MSDPTTERPGNAPADDLVRLTVLLSPNAHQALTELAQISGNTRTDVLNQALMLYRSLREDLAAGNLYQDRDGEMTRFRLAPDAPRYPLVRVWQDGGSQLEAELLVDRPGSPTVQVRYVLSRTTAWVLRRRLVDDWPLHPAELEEVAPEYVRGVEAPVSLEQARAELHKPIGGESR